MESGCQHEDKREEVNSVGVKREEGRRERGKEGKREKEGMRKKEERRGEE